MTGIMTGSASNETIPDQSRPDLILGYTGSHYQSLLPSDSSQLRLSLSPASSPQKSPSKTVSNTAAAGVVGAFFSPGSSPAKLTDAERKRQEARERQKKSRAKRKAESSCQPKAKLSDAEKKEKLPSRMRVGYGPNEDPSAP